MSACPNPPGYCRSPRYPSVGGSVPCAGAVNEGAVLRREYTQLEQLCSALSQDLQIDMSIHVSGVLPSFLHLPALVAEEYCGELVKHLRALLKYRPPPGPSTAAVRLLVAVSSLQSFLAGNGLAPRPDSAAHLDAIELFGDHVLRWIRGSRDALVRECKALEAAQQERARRERRGGDGDYEDEDGPSSLHARLAFRGLATPPPGAGAGGGQDRSSGDRNVGLVVRELLADIGSEIQKYDEVVAHWPLFGPHLEGAVCEVARELLACLGRQSGALPSQMRKGAREATGRGLSAGLGGSPLRARPKHNNSKK